MYLLGQESLDVSLVAVKVMLRLPYGPSVSITPVSGEGN